MCCGVQTEATLGPPSSLCHSPKSCMAYNEREQKVMSVLLAFSPSRHYRSIHVNIHNDSTFLSTQGIWKPQNDVSHDLLLSQTCIGSSLSLIHSESLTKRYTMYVKVPV